METVENAGFYFEKSLQATEKTLFSPAGNGVMLEEFGRQVIHSKGIDHVWKFFMPKVLSALDIAICDETNSKVVLFYGSLYSGASSETVRPRLLNIKTEAELYSCLRDFSGVYSGIIYLKDEKRAFAFTDQCGIKKLYYSVAGEELKISSHIMLMAHNGQQQDVSSSAFGSIVYCGHIFCDSIFKGISQINAACCAEIWNGRVRETEYVRYPQPQHESFQNAVTRVREAHLDFWKRMQPIVGDNVTMLLSRGKDARTVLKYMLDTGINPRVMSFYRKNNPLYPFACILQEWMDDYDAACKVKEQAGITRFEGLEIPNAYLLHNLDRIVALNHGTPLHWEFLAAAEAAAKNSQFIVTGFVGDVFAGKSHHYYLMQKIRSASEYGLIEFRNAGVGEVYSRIAGILKSVGMAELPSVDEMALKWQKQYQICCSEDLNIIFQQGLFRTRVLGRTGPTFDQMRLFAHPVYPYNDNTIIDAYRSLPEKYLRWEKAHVAQLADDPRFVSVNTTRLKVNVNQELRLLNLLGWMRRLDTLKRHRQSAKKSPSVEKDETFKRTLSDLGADASVWNQLATLPRTQGFYQTVVNLISALRIKNSIQQQTHALSNAQNPPEYIAYEYKE